MSRVVGGKSVSGDDAVYGKGLRHDIADFGLERGIRRRLGRILKRLTYNCWITIEEVAAFSATTSIRSSAIGAAAITAPLATRVAKVGSVCPQLS